MTDSRFYPASESAPVAWRWRNILGGPDHWTYSAQRPADHPQYITEPLYVAPRPSAAAQAGKVTFEEPRNVTAADREYASELLADLTSDDLPHLEIAARWFRKARVEHSLPGNHAQSSKVPSYDQLRSVFEAAYGLCIGYDWNNGTAAKHCGYKRKLLSAVNAIKEVPDFEGKYTGTSPVPSTVCTCAALGKNNIPHARNCPAALTSTPRQTDPDWKQDQAETSRLPPADRGSP